jgi:hypothetical protein
MKLSRHLIGLKSLTLIILEWVEHIACLPLTAMSSPGVVDVAQKGS